MEKVCYRNCIFKPGIYIYICTYIAILENVFEHRYTRRNTYAPFQSMHYTSRTILFPLRNNFLKEVLFKFRQMFWKKKKTNTETVTKFYYTAEIPEERVP